MIMYGYDIKEENDKVCKGKGITKFRLTAKNYLNRQRDKLLHVTEKKLASKQRH